MKKSYKSIRVFCVLLILACMKLGAQPLNGNYSINSGQSTGGTNFASFTAFANALNSNGVSGPVNVTVTTTNGVYNEQITLTAFTGASSVNKVTIHGNGNTITYNANSSQPWTIGLNGTDFFSVNNLNVVGTNNSYAYPMALWSNANNNTFTGCTFSVNANITTSYAIPFMISGNGNYYQTYGPSGNNNTVTSCTLFSGYSGFSIFGDYNMPYCTGNVFDKCVIRDWYQMGAGIWYYVDGTTVKNCTIDCPTRTTNSVSKYGVYAYGTQNTMIESCWIKDLYVTNPGYGGQAMGILMQYNTESSYTGMFYPSRNRNIIRNNVISDLNNNSTCYGIYAYYYDGEIYNNTISLDYANATSGTVYGIYSYAYQANYVSHVTNNIVSITRGGTSTKYCYMNASGSTGSDLTCDRNDFYISPSGGNNYVGYHNANATTLAQLQSQGVMATGFSANPTYSNVANKDYHPTNAAINNTAIPMGLQFDQLGAVRNPTTPDIGALEFLTPMCNYTPTNAISGPTYALCPGENAYFGIQNLTSDAGITYAWQVSNTSNVGPWTPIPNASGITYTALNQTVPLWYSVVIACNAPGGGTITSVHEVTIAGTTTSTVQYDEGFEGIGIANRKPNCSWSVPNLGGSAKTQVSALSGNRLPRSGNSYATFENTAPVNYYYTNGIWMEPGITYSASMWYQTDLSGSTNWTNLSIMLGAAQSSNGLNTIASTNGAAVSPIYKPLSNTFTVAAAGFYYVAIKANATQGGAAYLSWDDLKIEIPCTPTINPISVNISAPNLTVCAGQGLILTASGASTYTWNTGANTAVISVTPFVNPTMYSVMGTNALTGCSASTMQTVFVKQSPNISVSSFPIVGCAGKPVTMAAAGAVTYNWNTGASGAVISVTPTGNTSYTVIGTNNQNCTSSAVLQLNVNPSPNVIVSAPQTMCYGEVATMTASGAQSYQWLSSSTNIQANPATISPLVGQHNFTVIGTDQNNCTGSAMFALIVDACTGLNESAIASGVRVFPNPTNGEIAVELSSGSDAALMVVDVTGRTLINAEAADGKASLNLSQLASGVYYVKIVSGADVKMIKVIRN